MPDYLDETKLGEELKYIFKVDFIHNKTVPNSKCLKRPDYRNDVLMLIVEHDGDTHYTSPKRAYEDTVKDTIYNNMGYKIVHIPYFVQLSGAVVKKLFNMEYDKKQYYPHGFIDAKALLPAYYCEIGIKKFLNDLKYFNFISHDIIQSLKNITEVVKEKFLVIPPSLLSLLE